MLLKYLGTSAKSREIITLSSKLVNTAWIIEFLNFQYFCITAYNRHTKIFVRSAVIIREFRLKNYYKNNVTVLRSELE
jgi:hypothetical protein